MSVERFEKIIENLLAKYDVIDFECLKELETTSIYYKKPICLLTFDDGLLDHFTHVFPVLKKYGIKAGFYPSSSTVLDGAILGTHMLLSIFALVENLDTLVSKIKNFIFEELGNKSGNLLLESLNLKPERYSVERTLDRDLPRHLRNKIVLNLFEYHVTRNFADFAKEIYMNESQILELKDSGMHIGSHLNAHEWVSTLNHSERINEVDLSLSFLRKIGMKPESGWTLAYPFGDFDDDFVNLVNSHGCTFAFGVKNQPSNLDRSMRLKMSRINADLFSI
jgi:peptidoglycan/xylan/chitin deacetylase (PgdA/CDA1 family)